MGGFSAFRPQEAIILPTKVAEGSMLGAFGMIRRIARFASFV
jgi:hypothetical protein